MDNSIINVDKLISMIVKQQESTNRINNNKHLKTIKWSLKKIVELSIKISKSLENNSYPLALKKKKRFDIYNTLNKIAGMYRTIISSLFSISRKYENSYSDSDSLLINRIKEELLEKIMECHCALVKINRSMLDLVDKNGFQYRSDSLNSTYSKLDQMEIEMESLDNLNVSDNSISIEFKIDKEDTENNNNNDNDNDNEDEDEDEKDESSTMDKVFIDENDPPIAYPDSQKELTELEKYEQEQERKLREEEKENDSSDDSFSFENK